MHVLSVLQNSGPCTPAGRSTVWPLNNRPRNAACGSPATPRQSDNTAVQCAVPPATYHLPPAPPLSEKTSQHVPALGDRWCTVASARMRGELLLRHGYTLHRPHRSTGWLKANPFYTLDSESVPVVGLARGACAALSAARQTTVLAVPALAHKTVRKSCWCFPPSFVCGVFSAGTGVHPMASHLGGCWRTSRAPGWIVGRKPIVFVLGPRPCTSRGARVCGRLLA